MTDKHTPGEWFAHKSQTYFAEIIAPGAKRTVVIARLTTPQTKATLEERRTEAGANAALICAAPALLAAARLVQYELLALSGGFTFNEAQAALDAAIKKAGGT